MREILFRGKRVDNGEWETSVYPYGKIICGTITHDFVPSTVGQYTGMKDKNGKRIFEGDIVRVAQGKEIGKSTVYYDNGAFCVMPICGNILEQTLWDYWHNDWDIELIGNIHDNPELLDIAET